MLRTATAMNPGSIASNPPTEIVRHAATRLVRRLPSVVRYDDLYYAGLSALVEASRRFDVSRGVDFRTYAKHRVYGAMLDELRRLDIVSRYRRRQIREGTVPQGALPTPRLVDLSAAASVADPSPNVEDELDHRRALQRMRQAFARLPERDQLVVRLRCMEQRSLKAIGDHFGISEVRACQLVGAAVRQLRESMSDIVPEDAPPPHPSCNRQLWK